MLYSQKKFKAKLALELCFAKKYKESSYRIYDF